MTSKSRRPGGPVPPPLPGVEAVTADRVARSVRVRGVCRRTVCGQRRLGGERPRAGARARRGRHRRWLPLAATVAVLVLVTASSAAASGPEPVQVLALAKDLNQVLNNTRNWIMGILAGLATVSLSIGGVRYLMSSGEPGEVGKAKEAFKNAAWGYGLAALAPVVVAVLKGIVGPDRDGRRRTPRLHTPNRRARGVRRPARLA